MFNKNKPTVKLNVEDTVGGIIARLSRTNWPFIHESKLEEIAIMVGAPIVSKTPFQCHCCRHHVPRCCCQ